MMEILAAVGAQNDFTQFGLARARKSFSEKVNLYWKSLSHHTHTHFLTIKNNWKEYFKIGSGFHTKK